jgi:hypothetical protein
MRPVAVVILALLAVVALGGCGDDEDSEGQAASGGAYVERANTICREGVREAKRIGRRSQEVDPGDRELITAIFVEPGIALLERQAERLRRIDAPPEDESFHTYVGLYDPAAELVRRRVEAARAGDIAEAQNVGTYMDQLSVDSRKAAQGAGLDDCNVDIARTMVEAAAGE